MQLASQARFVLEILMSVSPDPKKNQLLAALPDAVGPGVV